MRRLTAILFLALALVGGPAFAKPLKVVASFSVLGDIVGTVGGDRVALETLVGPDGDAHTFEPSPGDAKVVAEADLIFVNGLGLEPWMERLIESAGYKGRIVVASQGVAARLMQEEGEGGGTPATVADPHAWQDPANGQIYVRNVAEALSSADPSGAEGYGANAERYAAELTALDAWTRSEIGALPPQKRRVITTHDAFGYFGAAYGVSFLAAEGISTESEPTARDLAKLVDQIKTEKIRALFIENMSDPRLMRTIAREAKVELGGELFADALSPPDGPAPTYPAMFRNNVPKLKAAMQQN